MAKENHGEAGSKVPCCPPLEKCEACDVLDLRYRLPFRSPVEIPGRRQTVAVEVLLRFRLERCPGPLALGARRPGLHSCRM